MSALAEALEAAQRRAVAVLGKQYVGGTRDEAEVEHALVAIGLTDDVDRVRWFSALDVIRDGGGEAPAESNGDKPRKASEAQVSFIVDLLKRGNHGPLAESDLRNLPHERASELITALKSGSYKPEDWDVPF